MDNRVIGYVSTVPIFIDDDITVLPDEGYTWAIKSSIKNSFKKKNALCALAAVIDPEYKNLGLSKALISVLKAICLSNSFSRLIVPVRSVWKERYSNDTIDEFLERKREDGLPFDPWLRAHVLSEGIVRNICHRSITICSSKKRWEKWISHSIVPGRNELPGGLAPLYFNVSTNIGTYTEPNIWVDYNCSE